MPKIIIDENKIKDILTRGVEDIIVKEHLEAQLKSGKQLRVKFGIDPTGPKIHLGRAIPLKKLRAFQELGHKIVLIIGDFTATIGDPSDKLSKRPMLTKEQVEKNMKDYEEQLGKIIDMGKAEIHYNSKWLDKLTAREMSQLAESFSLQQMSARRNFKERIEKGEEIFMSETFYPLYQGYDSVMVKSNVEVGGFDQLFNVKAGRIIQKHYNQPEQDILTVQMLEGTDGRKMSTSWGNVITIVDEPNDMFGKIMSIKDELIEKYYLLCTDVPEIDIKKLQENMQSGKLNPRDAKSDLAFEIVKIYHGDKKAETARDEFINIFSEKKMPKNAKPLKVGKNDITILELAEKSGLFKSRGEIKRIIEQGGVRIAGKTYKNWGETAHLEGGEILQIGKKDFWGIKI